MVKAKKAYLWKNLKRNWDYRKITEGGIHGKHTQDGETTGNHRVIGITLNPQKSEFLGEPEIFSCLLLVLASLKALKGKILSYGLFPCGTMVFDKFKVKL